MVKKLLVPTDFSKNSQNAIEYAIKLYKNEDCDFYILNTYANDTHGLDSLTLLDPDEAFNKLSEKRSKQSLDEILTRLTLENKNQNHRFHVLSHSNLFLDAIKDSIETMKIDMLVIGANGATTKGMCKYGKNTVAAIENIRKCPILVVPENAIFNSPKEIILATNFKNDFNIFDIKHLSEIAQISNSRIQILSLEDANSLEEKKNKTLLMECFKNIDHNFNIISNVEMQTALKCFIKISRNNIISYIINKRTFGEKIGFGKPSLSKLGYFENIPILALNEK